MSSPPTPFWTDDRIEKILGNLLRYGVIAAALIVLTGGVLYLAENGRADPRPHRTFHGEPAELRSFSGIVGDALHGDSLGIIQFGLLVLIATPVARVAFSVLAFLLERDWTYVIISAFVLGMLLYSLMGEHR